MITVIGLGNGEGIVELLDRLRPTVVIARQREIAERALDEQWDVDRDYDALFESDDVSSITSTIAADLAKSPSRERAVYLVPWSAQIGDLTVARMTEIPHLSLIPGSLPPHRPASRLSVIDALELAEAQHTSPFDSGLAALDATAATLVLNTDAGAVGDLARQRIKRLRPEIDLDPSEGYWFIEPKETISVSRSFSSLLQIVAYLRSPDGCPWDREQTPESLVESFLEEAGELRDAIQEGDVANQTEELGDVLLHILMQTQIHHEAREFSIEDVIQGLSAKLIRRHPHVFGDAEVSSVDELYEMWEEIKREEKRNSSESRSREGG